MRERSTWNREEVMKKAAALNKVADPYTMNQTRTQPPADEYVTGDPSTFAEDVHTPNTWESEYAGDDVRRNEIGMPEMRGDTFNHPEKTASKEVLLKKADLCIAVAKLMMKDASEEAIEDQSVSLMHLPDQELIDTHKRLAGDDEDDDDDDDQGGDQDQDQQSSKKADDEGEGDKAAAEEGDKAAAEDEGEKKDDDEEGQEKKAKDVTAEEVVKNIQAGNLTEAQEQIQQLVQAQQAQAQQAQDQQVQVQDVQQVSQQVQDMIQEALQQQTQTAQPQEQVIQTDEQVLDDMLAGAGCQTAETDIQMEPAQMDVTVEDLGPEDEVLQQLFAAEQGEDEKKDEDEGEKKEAAVRTASTRTVGTKPTEGVSKLGGASSAGGDEGIDKLSKLWKSAPDVRDVFGTR